MFDVGWTELLVIGSLALIVVGPKELPGLLRTVGQYVAKARSVAREFQRSMEDAAREADISALKDLKDAKREFDKMARVDFSEQARRTQASLNAGVKKPAATTAPAATPASAEPSIAAPVPTAEPVATPSPAPEPQPAAPAQPAEPAGVRSGSGDERS